MGVEYGMWGKRWHVVLRGESCMQWLGELDGRLERAAEVIHA